MTLASDVLDLIAVGQLLDDACAGAYRLNGIERDDQDLEILRLHWRAVGLSEALAVLTGRPALVLHLEAAARAAEATPCACSQHPSRLRTLTEVAPSPEKPEPAAVVDAGSGSHGRDNGAEDARPAGDGGARVDAEGSVW